MDNRTEVLADGVWRVEVQTFVNVFVLADNGRDAADGLTLVDTGTPAAAPRLVRSIRLLGFDPRSIGTVLLTHWHADHAGSAAALAASSAAPEVWAGEADRAAVATGRRPPPPAGPAVNRFVLGRAPVPPAVPGVRSLAGGSRRDTAGGLEVVATPGHTAGHVAFLLADRGVLLAGDALWNIGRPSAGPRHLCADLDARRATLARLAGLDVATVGVAHGPPISDRVPARLAAVAARA